MRDLEPDQEQHYQAPPATQRTPQKPAEVVACREGPSL